MFTIVKKSRISALVNEIADAKNALNIRNAEHNAACESLEKGIKHYRTESETRNNLFEACKSVKEDLRAKLSYEAATNKDLREGLYKAESSLKVKDLRIKELEAVSSGLKLEIDNLIAVNKKVIDGFRQAIVELRKSKKGRPNQHDAKVFQILERAITSAELASLPSEVEVEPIAESESQA